MMTSYLPLELIRMASVQFKAGLMVGLAVISHESACVGICSLVFLLPLEAVVMTSKTSAPCL